MKITDIKAGYPKYQHVVPSWRTYFWQIVVRVETDLGTVGLGYDGGGVAGVEIVNRHFRELLVGREVNSVEDIASIWDCLYTASIPYGRKGLAIMALSGVDLALYDLLGEAEGTPVYGLLGGIRKSRVLAYATGEDSELYSHLGYKAHKFPHRWAGKESDYDVAIQKATRARELFGPTAKLMVDTYMSWNKAVAAEMARRLAQFNLYWYERHPYPDDLEGQAEMQEVVRPTLIAGGEHEFTHYGFAEIVRAKALDLWQPDITWCGGLRRACASLTWRTQRAFPYHRTGEARAGGCT
jgi:L-rhamnonate dehydratase